MGWKRINPGKDPRGTGFGDEDSSRPLSIRYFGLDGKKWPRLFIVIFPNVFSQDLMLKKPTGIMVEVHHKKKIGDYWDQNYLSKCIPIELYDQFLEMLEEARNKILNLAKDNYESKTS